MEREEWRTVPGSTGLYEVSDLGRVRRIGRRVLAQMPHNGYARVCLSIGNKQWRPQVQHLVLAAFVGPRPKGMQCAHSDGVRSNNQLSNLAYKTKAQNEADKIAHGTSQHGERNQSAKLNESLVREIRKRVSCGEYQKNLSCEMGVSRMAISRAVRGESWAHIK